MTIREGSTATVKVTLSAKAATALTRTSTRVSVTAMVTNAVGVATRTVDTTVAKGTGTVVATAANVSVPKSGRATVGTVACPAGAGTCTVTVGSTATVRLAGRAWALRLQATRRMRPGTKAPLTLTVPTAAWTGLSSRPTVAIRIPVTISNEGGSKRATIAVRLRR